MRAAAVRVAADRRAELGALPRTTRLCYAMVRGCLPSLRLQVGAVVAAVRAAGGGARAAVGGAGYRAS